MTLILSRLTLFASRLTLFASLYASGFSQTEPRFEVVSIKSAPPADFFHASDTMAGGPGTADPGLFHCTCTLAALIGKAFELQRYQFPGHASLPSGNFDISAKIPAGTTPEQFQSMLRNLLADRFGLKWHYEQKEVQGYRLAVTKNGPKLQESSAPASTIPVPKQDGHDMHAGLINFNGRARYRGVHQSMAELALLISSQIARPVEDGTGLLRKLRIFKFCGCKGLRVRRIYTGDLVSLQQGEE